MKNRTELKRLIEERRTGEAWSRILAEARQVTDYAALSRLCRLRGRLMELGPPPSMAARARVALLSGATTAMLEAPLQLCLEAAGVGATIHRLEYGSYARDMLDPASEAAALEPDVAVVITTHADLPAWPAWNASRDEVERVVDEVCEHWTRLCEAFHANAGCDIILCNYHALPVRPLGAAGTRTPGDPNRFLRRVNDALAERLPAWVHIHDVAGLASLHGVQNWFDARFWHHAKQPVSFACLVPYVRNVAQMIGAMLGRSAKCIVLDLDNTLWGGVVGDDGVDALVLGQGDPVGEAFTAFQRYLRQLKERGVMLAVCSKNEEDAALGPFRTRPDMVLGEEDFVAFRANWRPKSANLVEIAETLNIGLDALVFVDDNPAEREEVRRALPEVRIVELGSDPSDYPALLDRTGWFETLAVSAEDRERSRMYRANEARERQRSSATDYDAYLRSLEQLAVIAPFDEPNLDRITQLTNKTNQFNLTTRRTTRTEMAEMMASPAFLTAYVRLADRFGDNGLISVFAARLDGPDAWIDFWLMSCRVFNRGVERLLMNHVVERARAAGCRSIHGIYRPTERNKLVRNLYGLMGFEACGESAGGDHWVLDVDRYQAVATEITVVDRY